MDSNLINLHNECLKQVFDKKYYTENLEGAFHLCGYVSLHQVQSLSDDSSISKFWNTFFELLPDNDEINTPPFDLVSDLATYKIDDIV